MAHIPAFVPPLDEERHAIGRLVESIVVAQGNRFIKEFLRNREIRIGRTKADFKKNLEDAVGDGRLTRMHLEEWLREVEGWGNQHVYLYAVQRALASDPIWRDPDAVLDKLRNCGFGPLLNTETSFEFPDQQELKGVYWDGTALQFIWHQGSIEWIRDPMKDKAEEEIDGSVYQFRAYRRKDDRHVARFEIRPRQFTAAIFLQTPWSREGHTDEINHIKEVIGRIIPIDALSELPFGRIIRRLDDVGLQDAQGKHVRAHSSRLIGNGAYVEFVTTTAAGAYQDSDDIRDLRLAIPKNKLKGGKGTFFVSVGEDANSRMVKMQVFGDQKRIRLWFKMTSNEVWEVLRSVKDFSN